jgi:hypothetical protein
MTDRELLELAAKAADLPWEQWCINGDASWNPLIDDGDALRLAVKLGMYLNIYTHPKMQQTNVGAASRYLVTEAH